MNHLVNYLCHFPMGIGATRLSTAVAENSDQVEYGLDDLRSDIFAAPNVQVGSSYTSHLTQRLTTCVIGATRLSTAVTENSDQVEYGLDDLRSDIFAAPNVQVGSSYTSHLLTQRTGLEVIKTLAQSQTQNKAQ